MIARRRQLLDRLAAQHAAALILVFFCPPETLYEEQRASWLDTNSTIAESLDLFLEAGLLPANRTDACRAEYIFSSHNQR